MNLGFAPYGAYVWSAVALFVLVTLANAWAARAVLRSALERARRAHSVRSGGSTP